MISIKLMGGLGNQLFMIFTTLAYGIENKVRFILPQNKPDKTSTNGDARPTYWHNFLKRLTPFLQLKPEVQNIYSEKGHHYTKIPEYIKNKNILLFGYFQSYKYFENQKELIFKIIGIRELQNQVREKYSSYFDNQGETVSLHFRIGDYKNIQDCHSVLKIEYYIEALKTMLEHNNSIKNVVCFGEKSNYVELLNNIEILKLNYPNLSFELCSFEIEDWEQMVLMSCCEHNIIANSSFSWWGAYFNDNPEKIVCYPSVWFGPKLQNKKTEDMFPKDWKKIN